MAPVLPKAKKEPRTRNKKCLFRLALLKDQLGPGARMYWSKAKYHDFAKEKTFELGRQFFTMGRDRWIKTYLEPDKNGMGFRIYDGLSDKKHKKQIEKLLASAS